MGPHVLGKVARRVGGVGEERDNRDEEESERRAVWLAAALARHGPHAAKVERGEKAEKRRVGETKTRENPDKNREQPARILPGSSVRDQERRGDERPRCVERERAQVGERLLDGWSRHEYDGRDYAGHAPHGVGVLRKHLAAYALADEKRGQVI